jgi:hypothetical protein
LPDAMMIALIFLFVSAWGPWRCLLVQRYIIFARMENPMKQFFRFLIAVVCLLTTINLADAQWTQTNGPFGGYVNALAVSGTTLLTGLANGSIYRSVDHGTSWTLLNAGMTKSSIHVIAASGTSIYAGTDLGLFLSTNDGQSWTKTDLEREIVISFAVSGTHLFAGTSGGGIYVSTNGINWTSASTGLPNFPVNALAVSGTNVFAGTDGSGVFRSVNNGSNWARVSIADSMISSLCVTGSNIYAGTHTGGVFRSKDNGVSWIAVNYGLKPPVGNLPPIYALAVSGSDLYAGTYHTGVFHFTEKDSSWNQAAYGLMDIPLNALAISGSTLIVGTYGSGVFTSTDNGLTWNEANSGVINTSIHCLAVSQGKLYAASTSTNGGGGVGVFVSRSNGEHWESLKAGLTGSVISAMVASDTDIFVGASRDYLGNGVGGILRASGNFTNWALVHPDMPYPYVNSLAFAGTNLIAGTWGGGIFYSTDHGNNWSAAGGDTLNGITGIIGPIGNDTLCYAATDEGVCRSFDKGMSWVLADSMHTTADALSLAASGDRLFAGSNGRIYRSTDHGSHWTELTAGLPSDVVVHAFAFSGSSIFAGTTSQSVLGDGGVFLSTDNGTSWTPINTGLLNSNVYALAASGTYLYAGTDGDGIWKRQLSEVITSVPGPSTNAPSQFSLDQNFPNPFNPSTTIRFILPARSYVTLKIFDALGRQVSVVVSEELPAGTYSRQWNAAGMSSGVYFYRLQAGSLTDRKKLLLLR